MRCPKCKAENPERAKFCLDCGASFGLRCMACGAETMRTLDQMARSLKVSRREA